MERDGRVWCIFLTACLILGSCNEIMPEKEAFACIEFAGAGYTTRAYDPDEQLVKDISLLIFDEEGNLEHSSYLTDIDMNDSGHKLIVPLLMNRKYSFYACANFGYAIRADTVSEIKSLKWHMAYPDEYREGMAMAGQIENLPITETAPVIRIPLKRIMAKISLQIDRSRLDENVRMYVTSVKVGNCPKYSNVFIPGKIEDSDGCFYMGFSRNESECSVLNRNITGGISGSVSLYILENMQGQASHSGISEEKDKTASYLEISLDYESPVCHTTSKPLIYRIYLGKDSTNLDVERNCHYHITVIPENDGLGADGWRIDKSGIEASATENFFEMIPSGYLQGNIGDTVKVRCSYSPPETAFDIGLEELEYDAERGIYDYIIDSDGHEVTLILRSAGMGIIYMSAGEPLNETGMLVIEVNKSKTN